MTQSAQDFELSTNIGRIDMKKLGALYASVGFGTVENYEAPSLSVERLFGPGAYGFFAFDGDHLIGMARVLSDDVMCSWIAEMCVHPDWQSQGVGGALLDQVDRRFKHTALHADAFKGQESFFAKRRINPQSRVVACGRAPVKS